MIYGQDDVVSLPVMDLYDSGMMQMYANAARDLYLQAREDQKEFLKTYGDFLSPILSDMEFWYNNTINPVNRLMSEALANGIDLIRSAEGRALLSRTLNSLPYGLLAAARQSAKNAEQYIKNRAELEAKGLWSPEYEEWLLKQQGLPSLENWDSSKYGTWNRVSPASYQDLNSATRHWYDQLKDSFIETKDGYDWYGITPSDLANTTNSHLSDFIGGDLGRFFLDKARQDLIAEGNSNPTASQLLDRLRSNIVTANRELTHRNREANTYDKMAIDQQYDLQRLAKQHSYDVAMEQLRHRNREEEANNDVYRAALGNEIAGSAGGGKGLPAGAWDVLDMQLSKNYASERSNYIKNYKADAYKKQKAAYDALSKPDKDLAVNYGKAYRMLYGNNRLTSAQKAWAENIIKNGNENNNLRTWRTHFLNRNKNDNAIWTDYATTEGRGKKYPDHSNKSVQQYWDDLRKDSYDIFNKNNIVTGLDEQTRNTLRGRLGYTTGTKGIEYGSMDNSKDFADIVVTKSTGTRRYHYNSPARKISRIIKGKKFLVNSEDAGSRKFASATIGGHKRSVITENVRFTDAKVIEDLKVLDRQLGGNGSGTALSKYGLTYGRTKKSLTEYWSIPISTVLNKDLGEGGSHITEDKQRYGSSAANSYSRTRQVRSMVSE